MAQQFWSRGDWVSTASSDEVAVSWYIQDQEKEDQRLHQPMLMPL